MEIDSEDEIDAMQQQGRQGQHYVHGQRQRPETGEREGDGHGVGETAATADVVNTVSIQFSIQFIICLSTEVVDPRLYNL